MSSRITENGERGKAVEYYLESKEKVLQELGTTEQGLTSEEAAVRLKEQGKNLLVAGQPSPDLPRRPHRCGKEAG